MTECLYNQKDIARVRQKLLKEQGNVDPLTMMEIPEGKAVLDHNHDTQYVRAVLHRQTNAALGKIENIWTRYLSYWYNGDLKSFLRQAATYLEKEDDKRWVHPKWLAKVKTEFNKLTAKQKDYVLVFFDVNGKNDTERKLLFNKSLNTKQYSFKEIMEYISSAKEIK